CDRDFYVRWRAASALGKIGNWGAVEGLLRSLKDDNGGVRGAAASALGKIGNAAATDGLQQALLDADSGVRHHAAEALKKIGSKNGDTPALLPQDSVNFDSNSQTERLISARVVTNCHNDKLPMLFITSCAEASEHFRCTIKAPSLKHLISIGSPGVAPPEGWTKIPHRLRLEFHDIETPYDDPEYVLATTDDIAKVINFASEISQSEGDLLIHCQAGISRSSAVALTVCTYLLGAGSEAEALAYVLAVRPQAMPNLWVVELADAALNRKGKLLKVAQKHQDAVFSKYRNYQTWDGQ
ncbi:MAG TPA: hypothetical protein DDW76_02245, partial [Cyanobacteria bacterium UBA11369]|nr:hypothetical protein [Cyanobacteria bacterium UBA11369]